MIASLSAYIHLHEPRNALKALGSCEQRNSDQFVDPCSLVRAFFFSIVVFFWLPYTMAANRKVSEQTAQMCWSETLLFVCALRTFLRVAVQSYFRNV